MAVSKFVNRYRSFPAHGNGKYHSSVLPLPNVVRIEVLSPHAKTHYTGLANIASTFRQCLSDELVKPEGYKPFYAFFDPEKNGDIGFDVSATWVDSQHVSVNSFAQKFKNVPILKLGTKITDVASRIAQGAVKMAGLNNDSTGACTMKEFQKADFKITKTIKCSWYMPEQEDMARLSISRLLRMAYVRNLSEDAAKDIGTKLGKAVAETYTAMKKTTDDITGELGGMISAVLDASDGLVETAASAMGDVDVNQVLGKIVQSGLDINKFFGGALTVNPLPVRLTMGHQLDIEPLVITNVKISGSKEQFMTTDGSNIPLFVNADIEFGMWMIPDPNKGFLRYLGDDIFEGQYITGKNSAGSDKK